jgi:hypothetical protein
METNYKNLKPGLARRLAYSRQLRIRRERSVIREQIMEDFSDDIQFFLALNSKVVMNKDLENFCNICQELVEVNRLIRVLKCSHVFHVKCIMFHFANRGTCPTCRTDIFT